MPNSQLTPGGVVLGVIVGWWIFVSASLRTVQLIQAVIKMRAKD